VKPKDAAEIHIGFAIALQATQNGAAKDQELGLIRRAPQPLREHVDCLGGLLQTVQ